MNGPLDGTLVLDLSRVLAGPWASQSLVDLGTRVIKVERPGTGDDTRSWGPPYLQSGEHKESAYFLSANRGKQTVMQLQRADLGSTPSVRSPVRFRECSVEGHRAPPALGDSTEAVLREIGLGETEIEKLLSDGVIAQA